MSNEFDLHKNSNEISYLLKGASFSGIQNSAGTIFDIDELAHINLIPEPEDPIHTISGVSGSIANLF